MVIAMASSLFKNSSNASGSDAVSMLRQIVGTDPNAAFESMYRSNPRFRQFADSMKGKSPEDAFREYGLDFNQYRGLF